MVVDEICRAGVFIRRCLLDNCHFGVRVLSVTPYVARPVLHDGSVMTDVCACFPLCFSTGCCVGHCWFAVTFWRLPGVPALPHQTNANSCRSPTVRNNRHDLFCRIQASNAVLSFDLNYKMNDFNIKQ